MVVWHIIQLLPGGGGIEMLPPVSISPNHEEWGADGKYTPIVAENKVTLIKVLCK